MTLQAFWGLERAPESKLVEFNDSTSTQLAVVTEKSLNGKTTLTGQCPLPIPWGIGQRIKTMAYWSILPSTTVRSGFSLAMVLKDFWQTRCRAVLLNRLSFFVSANYYTGLDWLPVPSFHFMAENINPNNQYLYRRCWLFFHFHFHHPVLILTIFIRRHSNPGLFSLR